jgi:phage shock protein A
MFKRLWGYIKTLFRVKTEAAMDPEIEIEQAIQEARRRDQELRNQAAKVVAHRVQLESWP